jgi:DNA-binding GntR family transcriptional regulator
MGSQATQEQDRAVVRGRLAAITLTRKDAVYGALEGQILELEIPPGARLVEADLAAEFGMSKTPIREALLLLERSRLVELIPYSGAHVTWLSVAEYQQLSTILDCLEQPLLPMVVEQCTPAQLAGIEDLERTLIEAHASHDGPRYRDTLVALHEAIFSIADNPHLSRILAEVGKLSRRYEAAFTHQFEDSWALELEVVCARVDALRTKNPRVGMKSVEAGHKKLRQLFEKRLADPAIARLLQP